MHIHIALYKWKSSVTSSQIKSALDKIKKLEKIPGIAEIHCALNTSRYSEGYTHVILVRAENQAAINAYRNHPEHIAAAKDIEAIEDKGLGVDFAT